MYRTRTQKAPSMLGIEMDQRVAIVVKLTTRKDQREKAGAAMRHVIEYADSRSETITYALFEDIENTNLLWGVHIYADREAFEVHRKSTALARTHEELDPCLEIPFEVVRLASVGGKGLPTDGVRVRSGSKGDERLGVLVRIVARPGKRDDVAEVLGRMREEADREPGTLVYHLFKDQAATDVLWALHLYADRNAFEAHRASTALKITQDLMAPLLDGQYKVFKMMPIAGKGLPC